MHCTRCGTALPDGSRFCSACGQDLFATTPVRRLATGQISEGELVREALSDEYEQFEELGRGGMALVYRARERQLERDVAIKVLPVSFTFDQEFVERFQREARTAASLEHPNIIPIYRVGQARQVIYFVMKFLRGGSLSDVLRERGSLRPPEIRRLLLEAGAALGYAAQRGVVHRDIKPDNIMVDEFGRAVLTDFGIAKAAAGQRLTGTGMSIGTPHYMSPEQARAQETDGRSDLYSLGVVAYQCLVGRVPFDGEDGFQIGYKHITEPLPKPPLATDDERRLFAVIERMLAKEPGRRFQSSEELAGALAGQEIAPTFVLSRTASAGPPVVLIPGELPSSAAPTVATPVGPPPPPPQPPVSPESRGSAREPAGPSRPPVRRIANRSAAMKQRSVGAGPIVLILLVLALGAGGWYWWVNYGPGASAGNGKAVADAPPATAGAPDSLVPATADSLSSRDSTPPAEDTPRPPATPATPRQAALAPPSSDSGAIRVRNLPVGSEVMIDEQRVMTPITPLPVGRHVVAISAPLHNFYAETVSVRRNDTLVMAPSLTRLGTPTTRRARAREAVQEVATSDPCQPGPQWDGTECFDVRPRPLSPPYVALPEGVRRVARPAAFWVHVDISGLADEVRLLRSSGSPAFDRSARVIAQSLEWTPAQKDGAAVAAWTQMLFPPAPR